MTKLQRDARAGWHAARRQPRPPRQLSTTVIGTPLPELTPCKCCGTSVCSKVPRGWAVAEPGIAFDDNYKPRGYDSAARWKVDNVTISGVIAPPEAERCQCGCWVHAEEACPKCQEPVPPPMQEQQKHDVLKWTFDGFCHRCQIDDSTKLVVSQNRVTIVAGGKRDAWLRHGFGLEGDDDAKAFVERKWRERGGE